MQIVRENENEWIGSARRCISPNFDNREEQEISLLVIHNISLPPNQFGNSCVEDFFQNKLDTNQHPYFETIKDLKVSSHLFIPREGDLIQFVPFNKRAWHAGVSEFQGRTACNNFSIGIELEGADTIPYTEKQYISLLEVTLALLQAYPLITLDRIVGHNEIAPGRKTDPGESFNWKLFKQQLEQKLKK